MLGGLVQSHPLARRQRINIGVIPFGRYKGDLMQMIELIFCRLLLKQELPLRTPSVLSLRFTAKAVRRSHPRYLTDELLFTSGIAIASGDGVRCKKAIICFPTRQLMCDGENSSLPARTRPLRPSRGGFISLLPIGKWLIIKHHFLNFGLVKPALIKKHLAVLILRVWHTFLQAIPGKLAHI